MKIIKKGFSCALVLVLMLGANVVASEHRGFSISNVEEVKFSLNTLRSFKSTDAAKLLSFYSFGKKFDLTLFENKELLNGFSETRSDIKLYAGTIQGNDQSWARVTVVGDKYTGAIFDGTELFLLDLGSNVAPAVTSKAKIEKAKTVIYKSSDLSTNLACGLHDQHASNFAYQNLLSDSARQQFNSNSLEPEFEVAQANATQQVNVRIVADTQYAQSSTLDAEAQVMSQMNIVDGIFSEQVGVQFGITEIQVLTNNGNLTSTNASTLLNQFRTFVGNNNPGLAHLFTGKNLDGSTIGIASLRGICRAFGVGLTQAGGNGTFGALTAAHEYGHNFGAPHDNQTGSACATSPGTFLMNPSLNGSDQFSQCSLMQIANTLVGAQCLIPVDTDPPEPAADCDLSINFADGANDFEFVDDPQAPLYSSGATFGSGINTLLGGVDGNDIADIEGVWSRQCLSDSGGELRFTVQASLMQSPEYEANEFSQIGLRVNGQLTVFDTITGDGNGGAAPTTGTQQYSVDVSLTPGLNTIELTCFNNLKTFENETTECRFNRLDTAEPTTAPEPDDEEFCFPIRARNSSISVVCL